MNFLQRQLFKWKTSFALGAAARMQLNDIQAFQVIHLALGDLPYLPFSSWSMTPSMILHILNDITINNRKRIIEFGAGMSTIIIAAFIKKYQPHTKYYVVESEQGWISRIRELMGSPLQDIPEFVHAPIEASSYRLGENLPWYAVTELDRACADVSDFDCVVVDGPPSALHKYSRYPAIPYLKGKLTANSTVFVDDSYRANVQRVIHAWQAESDLRFKFSYHYAYAAPNVGFDSAPLFEQYQEIGLRGLLTRSQYR